MSDESRRQFLERIGRISAAAIAGRALLQARSASAQADGLEIPQSIERPTTAGIDPASKSIVADVRSLQVLPNTQVYEDLLREMVEEGVTMATLPKPDGNPWNKVIQPDDVVGVKFDPVDAEAFATTLPMARQMVYSLMTRANIPPDRIMLIDVSTLVRRAIDETLSEKLGAKVRTRPQVFGFSADKVQFGKGEDRLADWLGEITALLNVPLLRTHNIAGVSGCLMNLAFSLVRRPGRYYAKDCTPFVADVLSLPQVRSKMRVNVVNGLRAVFDGGPDVGHDNLWEHRGILASIDPVAADAVGLEIINERRVTDKKRPIGDSRGTIPHIHDAAGRGLGTDDQDYLTIRYHTIG